MAAINDLISQIENPELRSRIEQEVKKLNKQKKFGLVFEEHLPECTPLYDFKIKVGTRGALKTGNVNENYIVTKIDGDTATCQSCADKSLVEFKVNELVAVAEFGEPIYPYLKPIDSVCNAPDSDLWHTLIEADNYHALQLLEYLYAGQVDCIYIDPPYNTGARDWKYNNDYIDSNDSYRHSKWLSMMEKRLKIAKKLLNPKDSVLMVTIDEKEYLHLGCLLEEMFPAANIQMVSAIINHGGEARDKEFSRTNEYIYFVAFGSSGPSAVKLTPEWYAHVKNTTTTRMRWREFRRTGSNNLRTDRPSLFYPIIVTSDGKHIVDIGDSFYGKNYKNVKCINECKNIWPLFPDGREGRWMCSQKELRRLINNGYVQLGRFTKNSMSINYIAEGEQKKVESGVYKLIGHNDDGSIIVDTTDYSPTYIPGTVWSINSHNASEHGSKLINSILCEKRFSFPKSLYAVHDTIRFFVANKPNALIVDFFAGSGTTLHAVNLLNAEDGGNRRCIMVTNNEVSDAEAKSLSQRGFMPGDKEWEGLGIARYVTWPRTVCSIEGHDINNQPLKGNYIGSDKPMSDGFKANASYFKLGFLDKDSIRLGRQFKEMLPLLWMKAGAVGKCPTIVGDEEPDMLILPENKFAVLVDETRYVKFVEAIEGLELNAVFIVTDSDSGYREMATPLKVANTYQLYRDYLDNFRINRSR